VVYLVIEIVFWGIGRVDVGSILGSEADLEMTGYLWSVSEEPGKSCKLQGNT
jgi:hypothetical protein